MSRKKDKREKAEKMSFSLSQKQGKMLKTVNLNQQLKQTKKQLKVNTNREAEK
jgi:hypothetical protein